MLSASTNAIIGVLAGTLLAPVMMAQVPEDRLSLLASCSDVTGVKATIQKSDAVRVRFSMAGSGQDCYSVSVSLGGSVVDGYLLGAEHPAIAEFERMRSSQPAIMPYVPPPPPAPVSDKPAAAAEPPAVPQPVSLAGFRGVDVNGRPVDLDRMKAKTIVVYFWSPSDRRAVKDSEGLEYVYDSYQQRSVEIVGVANSSNALAVRQICDRNEAIWPQILDGGGLAQQYHVDRAKPYLVLDQQRNVIATLSSATQIEGVLQRRLKQQ